MQYSDSTNQNGMNCLLIAPGEGFNVVNSGSFLPHGLAIIAAVLKGIPGLGVTVLNLSNVDDKVENHSERVLSLLEKNSIDVVLSGGNILHRFSMRNVFRIAKEWKENIVTIAGGAFVTGDPSAAMSFLENVDFGVIGEGERTLRELIGALKSGMVEKDFVNIDGLIYKTRGGGGGI